MRKIFIFSFFLFLFFAYAASAETLPNYTNLTAENIILSPTKPFSGQECLVIMKVKNNGNFAITSSNGLSSYKYDIGNFSISKSYYDTPGYGAGKWILAGQYINYYFEGKFTKPGKSQISFTINNTKELSEEKYDNGKMTDAYLDNTITKTFEIATSSDYDLSFENLSIDKKYIVVDDSVKITFSIKNIGNSGVASDAPFSPENLNFTYNDFLITSSTRPQMPTLKTPLEPGASLLFSYIGKFVQNGKKNLRFGMGTNFLAEKNFNNNSVATTTIVYGSQLEADQFEILNQKVSFISSTSAAISWETTKPAKATLSYGLGEYVDYSNKVVLTENTKQIATLKDLKQNSYYSYNINATRGEYSTEGGYKKFFMFFDDRPVVTATPSINIVSTTTPKETVVVRKEIPQILPVATTTTAVKKEKTEWQVIVLSGKDLNIILEHTKKKKNSKDLEYAMKKLTEPLVKGVKIALYQKYAINNFIVYGTKSNQKLNAAKRALLIKNYKTKNKKLPLSEKDWEAVIRMAMLIK